MRTMILVSVLFVISITATIGFADELSYTDLLGRLTDLKRLAELPEDGERAGQFSSYNRKSKYDEKNDMYIDWSYNDDGLGYIRKEGDNFVLAEMEGPGCIWRIWAAGTDKVEGNVKIYLDDSKEPVIDIEKESFFNNTYEPFTNPLLSYLFAYKGNVFGYNSYVPIPYSKSCKIVGEPGWGRYFHFGFTKFPDNQKVESFKRDFSVEEKAALQQALDKLQNSGKYPYEEVSGQKKDKFKITAKAGELTKVLEISGARAITALKIKMNVPAKPNDKEFLRELCLQIKWDGQSEPSVWSPIGDFFGTGPGANVYQSLPMGLQEDGWWYSYWYMPFAENALIEIVNDSGQDRELEFEIVHVPCPEAPSLTRFHAKWHRDAFIDNNIRYQIDWPILKTKGKGRYVGAMLNVWNPRGSWWGEGDEKIFVDGEKFPSFFGTGSEDYFGYAYCRGNYFEKPYHSQTMEAERTGHASVNRWHVSDDIPFNESIEVSIEKYFMNTRPTLYACTAYWYLEPGGEDLYRAVPVEERIGYDKPVTKMLLNEPIEGEWISYDKPSAGEVRIRIFPSWPGQLLSEGGRLMWRRCRKGDKFDTFVSVEKEGDYRLIARLMKGPSGGMFRIYLNDKQVSQPVDLKCPLETPTGEIDLGIHKFHAGDNKVSFEMISEFKNGHVLLIDYLMIKTLD